MIVTDMLIPVSDRVSDLSLGQKRLFTNELILKHTKLLGNRSLDCNLDSPWLGAKRKIRKKQSDVHIEDDIALKVSYIDSDTLKSSKFIEFQKSLRRCFDSSMVMVENKK